MTIQTQHTAKYVVYGLGLVATIATSPLYEYFGTTAFDQRSVELSTDVVHVPLRATVAFANPDEAEPFQYCGWDVVVELSEPISLGAEVVLWGLPSAWDQSAFDVAYADALSAVSDESEDSQDPQEADTGAFDTGTLEDTATEIVDTSVADTASQADGDALEPYEQLNPAHQVFYETMQTFSGDKYAYRVTDIGTLNGPLFEEYASMVIHDSMRILYYSECGSVTSHFVLTVLGEPTSADATVTMVAHQGEQIAQPIGCGTKADNPDHSGVQMSVDVE